MAFAWLAIGLVILVAGAEVTVRAASRLAALLGISPLVIGLTVVAFGTSSPELAVGLRAALSGQPDLVVGNAIGSNIFNILFILGASAIIAPLLVSVQLIRVDVPVMIASAILCLLAVQDGRLDRWEGAAGIVLLIAYTIFTMRAGKRIPEEAVTGIFHGQSSDSHAFILVDNQVVLEKAPRTPLPPAANNFFVLGRHGW